VPRWPKERFVAKLAWKGAGFLDAAELSLPFDLGRRPLYLALEPKPRVVSLDRTPARFSMLAENQENGTTQAASGIGVSLLLAGDEKTALATATTDARGRATFDVDTKRFGGTSRLGARARLRRRQRHEPRAAVLPDRGAREG
jgi:hypothetical protein